MRLAILPGRLAHLGRGTGGAGAPPNDPRMRKRAFRGGRSRDLSLQEGRLAARDLEVSTTTVRTVLRHSPDSRRCLGRGSARQPVRCHVTALSLSAANVASAVTVAESFANRSRFELGTDSPSSWVFPCVHPPTDPELTSCSARAAGLGSSSQLVSQRRLVHRISWSGALRSPLSVSLSSAPSTDPVLLIGDFRKPVEPARPVWPGSLLIIAVGDRDGLRRNQGGCSSVRRLCAAIRQIFCLPWENEVDIVVHPEPPRGSISSVPTAVSSSPWQGPVHLTLDVCMEDTSDRSSIDSVYQT